LSEKKCEKTREESSFTSSQRGVEQGIERLTETMPGEGDTWRGEHPPFLPHGNCRREGKAEGTPIAESTSA